MLLVSIFLECSISFGLEDVRLTPPTSEIVKVAVLYGK